jgi:prepilin signal peptidase PulO-like enzyme (type II secretory pathway)
MPFGPYLAAAAVFSYLHGTPIIESYLTVAGLR